MRLCDRDIIQWLDEGKLVIEPRRLSSEFLLTAQQRMFAWVTSFVRVFQGHTAAYVTSVAPKMKLMRPLSG